MNRVPHSLPTNSIHVAVEPDIHERRCSVTISSSSNKVRRPHRSVPHMQSKDRICRPQVPKDGLPCVPRRPLACLPTKVPCTTQETGGAGRCRSRLQWTGTCVALCIHTYLVQEGLNWALSMFTNTSEVAGCVAGILQVSCGRALGSALQPGAWYGGSSGR